VVLPVIGLLPDSDGIYLTLPKKQISYFLCPRTLLIVRLGNSEFRKWTMDVEITSGKNNTVLLQDSYPNLDHCAHGWHLLHGEPAELAGGVASKIHMDAGPAP